MLRTCARCRQVSPPPLFASAKGLGFRDTELGISGVLLRYGHECAPAVTPESIFSFALVYYRRQGLSLLSILINDIL